jgi:hypothetical protein
MLLEPQDVERFFKLHRAFMFFVNQRLKVISDDFATPDEFAALLPEVRLKVREAFLAHVDLIEPFVAENPAHLSEDELDIVRSWRHLVTGRFYVFRELPHLVWPRHPAFFERELQRSKSTAGDRDFSAHAGQAAANKSAKTKTNP